MKRKILIALGVYSLIFFLGGVYIITTIENSISQLNHLIRLHQVDTLRERLLVRVKNVQSDLIIRGTPHAKSIDTVIDNVRSLDNMSNACFECHHLPHAIAGLNELRNRINQYKAFVSRTLTIRANRDRLVEEAGKAFDSAEQLSAKISEMVHTATTRLSNKTRSSLSDISKTKVILYVLLGLSLIHI